MSYTIEHGLADVYNPRIAPHVQERKKVPEWLDRWEARRPRWLMELIAEFTGTFIYVYAGVGATTSFALSNAGKIQGYGDLLTIGFAYGFGIAFAIMVAGPSSGGHLSPAYTIAFAVFKGFKWRKVARYICAQILGGMVACLMVYTQYKAQFDAIEKELDALGPLKDSVLFSTSGPAGIFSTMLAPGQKIGYVFVNELFADIVLALVTFGVLDSSNFFASYMSAPFIIGCGYSIMIWAFGFDTLVLNTARDLGGRLAAAIIWGHQAFSVPGHYCAVSALTGVLATLIGALWQILFLSDSQRPVVNHEPAGSAKSMEKKQKLAKKGMSSESPSATVFEKDNGSPTV